MYKEDNGQVEGLSTFLVDLSASGKHPVIHPIRH